MPPHGLGSDNPVASPGRQLSRIEAKIERIRIKLDPEIDVFEIVLERQTDNGVWCESFGSERELEVFLQGVKAGATMAGWHPFEKPDIPHEPTRIFAPQEKITMFDLMK